VVDGAREVVEPGGICRHPVDEGPDPDAVAERLQQRGAVMDTSGVRDVGGPDRRREDGREHEGEPGEHGDEQTGGAAGATGREARACTREVELHAGVIGARASQLEGSAVTAATPGLDDRVPHMG
jgi:hypothetical protein